MADGPSQEYIRKIRNDIANYKATVSGLHEEIRRYENAGDKKSVRSMQEEIRRTEQMISNYESQLP